MIDCLVSAAPKPKGASAEAIALAANSRHPSSHALIANNLEKYDQLLDSYAKSFILAPGEYFTLEMSPILNDKGKYDLANGLLKTPAETVDFYIDLIKKYNSLLKVIINPFLPDHVEQLEALKSKLAELEYDVKIISDVDSLGESKENTEALSFTYKDKIHDKDAIKYFYQNQSKYSVVLTDSSSTLCAYNF